MPSKRDIRSFGFGFGAALLAGSMWPLLKDGVRPATKAVIRGAMVAANQMKTMSEEVQSEVEDMFAEVQFERAKQHTSSEIQPREGSTNHEPDRPSD